MAKKINLADLVFKVSDDGTLKVMAGSAKKAGKSLKEVEQQTDKTTYATKKGINQTANQTKNFANLARGISGSLVPAYATLAANVFALTAVFGFLKQAADYRVLKEGQANYAAITGVAYQTLTNAIIRATDAQVTYTDAAQAAAIGTAAGLSPEQLEKLGAAAKTVSIALGRDVTDSFNRLVRGVTKAEPELLDELGIILRLEPATKKYAAALGVSKESLNAFQRTQAVTNEVLDQVKIKFDAINAIMDPQTNKINKLTKAFDDLMNQLRMLIAGPAESLAVFFSENLGAAIGALGLFVLPILQGILPAFDEMAANAEKNLARHNEAVESAKTALNSYKDTSKAAAAQATRTFSTLQKRAQDQAAAAGLPQGRTGSGLRALQEGKTISARQAAAIKKQINDRNSAYFVANNRLRRNWTKTLDGMVQAHKVSTGRIKVEAKGLELFFKKTGAQILVGWKATMGAMSSAAAKAGRVINKAFAFFTYASIALLAFEGIKAGLEKMGLLGKKTDDAENSLSNLLQTQRDFNKELDVMLGKNKQLAEKNLTMGMNQLLKQNADMLAGAQISRNLNEIANMRANLPGDKIDVSKVRTKGGAKIIGTGTFKTERSLVTGRSKQIEITRNLTAAELEYYNASKKADLQEQAFLETITKLTEDKFPELKGILDKELPQSFDGIGEKERKFIIETIAAGNAVKYLEQNAASLDETLRSMGVQSNSAITNLKQIEASRDAYRAKIKGPAFDPTSEMGKADIAEEKRLSGIATAQRSVIDQTQALAVLKSTNAAEKERINQRIYGATILGQKQQVLLQINEKQAQIDKIRADIALQELLMRDATDKESFQEKIAQMKAEEQLLITQKKGLQDSINLTKQLGVVATEAFANSMQKGIQGVIEGTMSIKDAFKSMAASILQSLAQVLAKMLTMRILSSAFGIPMADGGIIPMAKGGIIKGYKYGGIATEPTYLVGEAGPEAVVPLPDGRSIPVNMNGSGGTNNVTINVDANGGTSSTMDGEKGKALGMAIQAAVMETIQREKRPGGVLSRN